MEHNKCETIKIDGHITNLLKKELNIMRIAILYICTGKYDVFWEPFYKSFENNFLPDCEKDYFVFTDTKKLYGDKVFNNIHRYDHSYMGWPHDTLMRFDIFLKAKDELKNFDYIFFFNANMECVQKVYSDEFLPNETKHEKLIMVIHPGYHRLKLKYCPFERNKKSTAYIPYNKGKYYVMGALNGGTREAFLDLIESLQKSTKTDLDNGIIAKVHDESHLNRYIIDRNDVKYLSPVYCNPEILDIPFESKICMIDKAKYFDVDMLKNKHKKTAFNRKIGRVSKFIICNIKYYIDSLK